jgi:hypothetical protein
LEQSPDLSYSDSEKDVIAKAWLIYYFNYWYRYTGIGLKRSKWYFFSTTMIERTQWNPIFKLL